MKRIYLITRDLHLYFGLFISLLVLVFAVSVFFLVHGWIPGTPAQPSVRTASDLSIPAGVDRLTGRAQVDPLRGVLASIGVQGEVNFVRNISKENRLVIPVIVPGVRAFSGVSAFSSRSRVSSGIQHGILRD